MIYVRRPQRANRGSRPAGLVLPPKHLIDSLGLVLSILFVSIVLLAPPAEAAQPVTVAPGEEVVMVASENGTIFVAVEDEGAVRVYRSLDGGWNWVPIFEKSSTDPNIGYGDPYLHLKETGAATLYLAFTGFDSDPVNYSVEVARTSSPYDATPGWSQSIAEQSDERRFHPAIATDADDYSSHVVYLAYSASQSGWTVRVRRSSNNGTSWLTSYPVAGGGIPTDTELLWSDGTLHLAYWQAGDGVHYHRGSNRAQSESDWGDADFFAGTGGPHFSPGLVADEVLLSCRLNGTATVVLRSVDGGISWPTVAEGIALDVGSGSVAVGPNTYAVAGYNGSQLVLAEPLGDFQGFWTQYPLADLESSFAPCCAQLANFSNQTANSWGVAAVNWDSGSMASFFGQWMDPTSDVSVDLEPQTVLTTRPNPFRSRLVIEYSNPRGLDAVRLDVIGADGRRVRELSWQQRDASSLRAAWNGRDDRGQRVATGTYFVHLTDGSETVVRKVGLLAP